MGLSEIALKAGFKAVDVVDEYPPLDGALRRLRLNDDILLTRGAHERAICHRLAIHLEDELRIVTPSVTWHVDCEYNLVGRGAADGPAGRTIAELHKRLSLPDRCDLEGDAQEHHVFPDVIVHHRGEQDNELVLEVKIVRGRLNGEDIVCDLQKLAAFSSPDKGFAYRHALFLAIIPAPDVSTVEFLMFAESKAS